MKHLCLAYAAQSDLDGLSGSEWQALRKETLDYVESHILVRIRPNDTRSCSGRRRRRCTTYGERARSSLRRAASPLPYRE